MLPGSMSNFLLRFREPLTHKIAERSNAKERTERIQLVTTLCSISRLSEIRLASTERKRSASRPHPPKGEKTSGVNEPCSMSITR